MQIESIPQISYENRIIKSKNKVVIQSHEICIERAKLITDSYKTTKGEHPTIRFAKAMEYLLSNMTIKIWEDEFIVGNRCTKHVGTPLYPEVRIDTIELDLDIYDTRPIQKFLLTDEERHFIRETIIPYWKNEEETVQARFDMYLNSELKARILDMLYIVDTDITNGNGHFFPGHENVFKIGLNGLIQKVIEKEQDFSEDSQKATFYKSVKIVLNGAKTYIQRYSKLAKEMANIESNTIRKGELNEISDICQNISENPPETFKEAIQLLLFTHIICGLEDGGFAISIGRLDQLLFPFYINDINAGTLTPEEASFVVKCFYLKLNTLWNYVLNKGIVAAEGPPIAANLTIGGLDKYGNDATNELTYLLLDAYKDLQTVQPTFSVRIHEKTPEKLLKKTGDAIKEGASIGLYNDLVMVPGLHELGYSIEDAREYAPIGCVEPVHPCKSLGCTNATQLNIVKCLELTLNNGTDMFTKNNYGVENKKENNSYSNLWDNFVEQFKFFLPPMVETMRFLDKAIAELNPQPFLSATTHDCIKRGLDITNGGAIYDFTTTQMIGLATVADSLAVIKKMVFEEKLLSLDELILILKKNYRGTHKGRKGAEWREIFINKVPKFGNDDDYVDSIAHDVAKMFCEELRKYTNYRGGKYNPGIYSTSFHLALGTFTAASADGRKSRDPLSNGVGPTNSRDKKGPTAIFNSIMKLESELMTNGNSLILAFHPNTLKAELFPSLIRSYFQKNGGFHVQFNVVGKETLCEAQINPDNYRGLVVRIAGYSVLFTELSKNAQDEIIARTEY
jgi:formate C-acetyltransferase